MENFASFPYTISNLSKVVHEKLTKEFLGQPDGFVHVGPEKFVLFAPYKDFADVIYNFESRHDDVFVCTHPRSGTTWTQEIVWLICNDFDYDTARNELLNKRVPYLERHIWTNETNLKVSQNLTSNPYLKGLIDPIYNQLKQQTTQRFIKTHIPIKMLPWNIKKVGAKIVYVARNPKDVAVSYYYLNKTHPFMGFNGDFESFVEFFMNNLTVFGPYWQHILDAWSHRNDENFHFMFYEDLQFETESTLRKLATFLEKDISDDALSSLITHSQIDNFKTNPSVNYKFNDGYLDNSGLVRRGKVGGNPEMSNEMSKKFDEWTRKNLMDSDLKFPYCNKIY